MKTEEALNISANLLGPILAAESNRPTSAEIAQQLFDLADAIRAEDKKRKPPAQVARLST